MSKTDKVLRYLKEDKFKEALSILVHFRIGFSDEEKRTLQIAHEILSGHSSFYESIGIDAEECVGKARDIVRMKYNIRSKSNENK